MRLEADDGGGMEDFIICQREGADEGNQEGLIGDQGIPATVYGCRHGSLWCRKAG